MNYLLLTLYVLTSGFIFKKGTQPVFYLDSVIVKGEASPTESVKDSVLKAGKIKSPENIFSLQPALYYYVSGKGYATLSMRGTSFKEIKVMLDGVPINIPYSGQFDLSQIPSGFIRAYSINPPTTPLIMGSNALSGMVNISTGYLENNVYTDFTLGKGSTFRNTIYVGKKLPYMSFSLMSSYERSQGYYVSCATPYTLSYFRKNSYFVKKGIMLKLNLKSVIPGILKIHTLTLDNEKGVPWNILETRKRYWRFPVWKNFRIRISHHINSIQYGIFYNRYYNILDSYDDSTFTSQTKRYAFHSIYNDHSKGGSLRISFLKNYFLKVDVENNVHREQPNIGKDWKELNALTTNTSFYASPRIGNVVVKSGIEYLVFNQEAHSQTGINGLFNVSTVYKKMSLSIGYSHRTRFPTLKEMYSTYAGSSYPNPDLRPENSNNLELDLTANIGKSIKLSFGTFYSYYSNLIEKIKIDSLYKTVNISNMRDYGADLKIEGDIQNAQIRLLLNVERARDENNQPPNLKPEIRGSFILIKPLPHNSKLFLNVLYTGKRYERIKDSLLTLSSYTIVNLTLSRRIGRFEFYGKINNLLDEYYEYSHGFPGRGRYEEAGIKINFK